MAKNPLGGISPTSMLMSALARVWDTLEPFNSILVLKERSRNAGPPLGEISSQYERPRQGFGEEPLIGPKETYYNLGAEYQPLEAERIAYGTDDYGLYTGIYNGSIIRLVGLHAIGSVPQLSARLNLLIKSLPLKSLIFLDLDTLPAGLCKSRYRKWMIAIIQAFASKYNASGTSTSAVLKMSEGVWPDCKLAHIPLCIAASDQEFCTYLLKRIRAYYSSIGIDDNLWDDHEHRFESYDERSHRLAKASKINELVELLKRATPEQLLELRNMLQSGLVEDPPALDSSGT